MKPRPGQQAFDFAEAIPVRPGRSSGLDFTTLTIPSTSAIPLRDYQIAAIQAINEAEARGIKRQLLVLPTGCGKTLVFSEVIRQRLPGRALILAHRDELIEQAKEKFEMISPGIPVGIVKAARNELDFPVVVASIASLHEKRIKNLPKDFRTVVIDECFPAGTLVDGRPIESIHVGDYVRSYNHEKGTVEQRRVARTFRRKPSSLVRLCLEGGASIVCTPDHPIYATDVRTGESSYIPASVLSCTHVVHTITGLDSSTGATSGHTTKDMRCVRDSLCSTKLELNNDTHVFSGMQGGATGRATKNNDASVLSVWSNGNSKGTTCLGPREAREGVLLRRVQKGGEESSFIRDDGQDESCSCIRSNEGTESDEGRFRSGEAESNPPCDGVEAGAERRKWNGRVGSAGNAGARLGLGNGGGNSYGPTEGVGVSNELQTGYCELGASDWDRGRRGEPSVSGSSGEGSEKAGVLRVLGVENIPFQEQRSPGEFERVCPDGLVYNFEVEGNNNYFVGGILVHNCHHSTATSYRNILEYVGAWSSGGPLILGVTATPMRGDKIGLDNIFDEIVFEVKILDMIAQGYLCDLTARRVAVPVDLSQVKSSHGDYRVGDLDQAMLEADAHHAVVKAIEEHASDRKRIITFTPAVKLAHSIAAVARENGINAEAVDGMTPLNERKDILKSFSSGDLRMVSNCGILTEGYDNPAVDCICVARPTKSGVLYRQMVGRGTRTYPGKQNTLILDIVGISNDHRLQTASSLTGLPLGVPKPKIGPAGFGGESESGGDSAPPSLLKLLKDTGGLIDSKSGKAVAINIDLFQESWAAWQHIGDGRWILPSGGETFVLIPNPSIDGRFDVVHSKGGQRSTLAEAMDLGYAQGIAESRAKTSLGHSIADKNANWRKQPISPNQRTFADSIGVDLSNVATRGEASDLLTVAKAQRQFRPRDMVAT